MTKRIKYLDSTKGLLILTVILGHIFTKGYLHDFIYTFHMPAFFIISGILFNYSKSIQKDFTYFLKTKIYTLFLPIFLIEVFGIAMDILNYGYTQNIFGYLYNLLHLRFNNGGNWFIFCLFISELLFYAINKLVSKKYSMLLVGILTFVCGVLLPSDHYYIALIGKIFLSLSFMITGYLFPFFQLENKFLFIASLFMVIISTFFNGAIELSAKTINDPIIFLFGAISGTYFIIYLGKKITLNLFSYLGQNTITIYSTHSLFILILQFIIPNPNSMAAKIIIFIFVLTLEYPVIYLFNKYIPFFIGKKTRLS